MITVLVVAALAIGTIGLVLGAKASDEKADKGSVTEQIDELRGELETEVDALQSAIDQVAGSVEGLATEEGEQVEAVAGIDAAVTELQQRLGDVEELLGLDEE